MGEARSFSLNLNLFIMKTDVIIIGIVGNTLYFAPFYGGDHIHKAEVSKWERKDWVDSDIADYSSSYFIELAYAVGIGYAGGITKEQVPPVTNADRYILLKYAMLEDKIKADIARWEEEDDAELDLDRDGMPF
jgi:hypothetical protein